MPPKDQKPSGQQKARMDEAMREFERAVGKGAASLRSQAVNHVREDEQLRQSAKETLLHVVRARTAAHSAASIALSRSDPASPRRRSLQDIGLVSGAAANVAIHRSVEQINEEKLRRRRAAGEDVDDDRSKGQPVFEHLERCAERVMAAELAVAKRVAEAKRDFKEGARRTLRGCAADAGQALIPEDEEEKRRREDQLLDSRPPILDALLSGDPKEIDSGLEVLAGPLVLYFRHYSNLWQMSPKIILIVISLPIIAGDVLTAINKDVFGWVPQLAKNTDEECRGLLGTNFFAMTAWLTAQVVTDISIVITRAKRHSITKPVVRAFFRGEGVEAAAIRRAHRAKLFTSFVQHSIAKIRGRKSTHSKKEQKVKRGTTKRRVSGSVRREERRQSKSPRHQKSSDGEETEDHPPHALDVVIPIEEATERGERALLCLARLENSGTRVPLALLTILSFMLGLFGAVYVLLPASNNCKSLALFLANAYVAFYYIFFVPNLIVCVVSVTEMTSWKGSNNHRLERFIDRYVARLDDILFLGHLPFCVFFAKRLMLKTTPPPLDGARLRAQLRRDEFVLTERKKQLEEAIEDCEDQLETVATIRRRARLTYRRKESDDPLGPVETLRVKRYIQRVPKIEWRQSFVPVYRELDPTVPVDWTERARGTAEAARRLFTPRRSFDEESLGGESKAEESSDGASSTSGDSSFSLNMDSPR